MILLDKPLTWNKLPIWLNSNYCNLRSIYLCKFKLEDNNNNNENKKR